MPIPHLRSIVTFVMMLFFFVNAFYLPVGSTSIYEIYYFPNKFSILPP